MKFTFPYIGNFIIPTDELIFFRGVGQPPTYFWGDEHPPAIVDLRPTAKGTISPDTIARRRKSEILISKSFPYISLLFW